ncbi:MAG TPA: hypothetical protein VKB40_04015 [Candidatus Acidoferrales bacterium]|nr:hypothetical protein [Candidatus Acidoferrales bacterium]
MPFMRRMIHLRFVATIFIAAPLATAGLVFARVMPGKRIAAWYPIHPSDVTALPPVTLWVWERPEDLSPIDPKTIGVAFLARTVFLTGDTISFRPRLQPLRLASGTPPSIRTTWPITLPADPGYRRRPGP